jgi:predicted nucleic acid-binding protein
MTIDRTTLLFFDASCLIAAAGSPTGGSGFLLSLRAKRYLRAAVSSFVLTEADRNIRARMIAGAWDSYQVLLTSIPFVLASVPTPLPHLPPVNPKDIHVASAASTVATAYLLTLDKGLLAEANQAVLAFPTLTPGDFIKTILPTHIDYPTFI